MSDWQVFRSAGFQVFTPLLPTTAATVVSPGQVPHAGAPRDGEGREAENLKFWNMDDWQFLRISPLSPLTEILKT
jgi:hypothetical protein